MVKDHPEMVDWVSPVQYKTPFYVSSYNYTKIAVDRVQAADQHFYNILLLATGTYCLEEIALLTYRPSCVLSAFQLGDVYMYLH